MTDAPREPPRKPPVKPKPKMSKAALAKMKKRPSAKDLARVERWRKAGITI